MRMAPGRLLGAGLFFAFLVLVVFRSVVGQGVGNSILYACKTKMLVDEAEWLGGIDTADVRLHAAVVAHNAEKLLTDPLHLHETRHCAPAAHGLALGEPMATMGVFGIPAFLATHDPIVTYNFSTASLLLVAALAMYLLVWEWTGSWSGAVTAAVCFGFHALRLRAIHHPFVFDDAWCVFALYFSRRLFAHGRWRDALGLGLAIVLQAGSGSYSVVASALVATPYTFWLFHSYGLRNVQRSQLAAVVLGACAGVGFLYYPYLALRHAGGLPTRTPQEVFIAQPSYFYTGTVFDPGVVCYLLALAGLLLPKRAVFRKDEPDPRWALALGGLACAMLATGFFGDADHQAFFWLSARVPMLGSIRGISLIAQGTQLAVALLAGLGLAGVARRLRGPAQPVIAGALGAAAILANFHYDILDLRLEHFNCTTRIRPEPEEIAFYERVLGAAGGGSILEAPSYEIGSASRGVLMTAFHKHRTSMCYISHLPQERALVDELLQAIDRPGTVAKLQELGFKSLIVHTRVSPELAAYDLRVATAAAAPGSGLTHFASFDGEEAYLLQAPPGRIQ
jgi:hypothetical protein